MLFRSRKLDLGDWHPRDIPKALLTNPALQKQQSYNLPPLEQWYVGVLHTGKLPGALVRANPPKPNTAYTRSLIDDAILRVPRLRWDLSDVGLRNFLTDEESIGVICTKYRSASANGWSFPPLSECREAWSKRYGPTKWDTDMIDWGEPAEEAEQPRAKPTVVAKSEPANVNVKPIALRAYRRF